MISKSIASSIIIAIKLVTENGKWNYQNSLAMRSSAVPVKVDDKLILPSPSTNSIKFWACFNSTSVSLCSFQGHRHLWFIRVVISTIATTLIDHVFGNNDVEACKISSF